MSTLITIIMIGLSWYLFFFLFPQYQQDKFRDNLFILRNEIFDYVFFDTNAEYAGSAYRRFEQLINGTIHYAHNIGAVTLFMSYFYTKNNFPEYFHINKSEFDKLIEMDLGRINDEDAINRFKAYRNQYNKLVAVYLVKRSLLLSFVIVVSVIGSLIKDLCVFIYQKKIVPSFSSIKNESIEVFGNKFRAPIITIQNAAYLRAE